MGLEEKTEVTLMAAAAWARKMLRGQSQFPARDASVLLAHLLKEPPEYSYLHPGRILTAPQVQEYKSFVKRRISGEPVAYIRGYQEFMAMDFIVDHRVLIPRPETEHLVEAILGCLGTLDFAKGTALAPLVADVGCGSGAVGISLAKLGGYQVLLTDISQDALSVSRLNAEKHGVTDRIRFFAGDLLDPLLEGGFSGLLDAVVSNPPYIPTGNIKYLPREVRFEPPGALDGGSCGLHYLSRLARQAGALLKPGGRLMMEIEAGQGDAVKSLLDSSGWRGARIMPDYAGRDRIALAFKGGPKWQPK